MGHIPAKKLLPEISFVTCVSNWHTYKENVLASLHNTKSDERLFECIPIDNVSNRLSAAQALNKGLDQSRANFVVFCHQDIIFPPEWTSCLFKSIEEIEQSFSVWGVIGFAGRCADGSHSGHVLEPRGEYFHPPMPKQVQTVDECCMVVKKESSLRFDESFTHFHLYGSDLCLSAIYRGMPCYTVDCCLEHLSRGNKSREWHNEKEKLIKKWWPKRKRVGNKVYTTSGSIRLHSPVVRTLRQIRNKVKTKCL